MDTQDKLRLGAKRVGGDLLDAVRKEKEEKSRAYEAWKFANRASNPETAERMWKQSAAGSVAEAAKDIMGTGKPVVRQKADRLSEARRGIYGKDKGGTGRYSDLKRVNSIMNLYDRYAEAYGYDEDGKVKLPSYAPDYGHALKESGLEDYIGMSREDVRQELDWLEYVDRYTGKSYKDTFWGNAKANYDMGRMDQDSSLAWNAYLAEQTEENRRKAETVDQLIEEVYLGNQAVYGDDGPLPWLSKTMANYLPQAIDQAGYAIGGGLLGAGVGALAGNPALGAKAGITAASGVYSYKTMQGAAFKNLVEAGYPEKLAAAAASDEALISAGIEMAGTAIDLATMFAGKGVNALTAGSLDKAMEALNKTAGKNAFTRFAAGLSKYGLNLSGEGLEEMLQEIVSIASERSPGQGKAELIKDSVEIIKAMLHGGDYSQGRVIEAGKEGVKIAAMMGGADAAANVAAKTVAKTGVNREYSAAYTPEQKRDIQTALVEEGLEIAPDSKEVQHAKKQLDQGKDLTGVQVRELVQANEKTIADLNRAALASGVEQRLNEVGETGHVETIATAIAKKVLGEELSPKENSALNKSSIGEMVLRETENREIYGRTGRNTLLENASRTEQEAPGQEIKGEQADKSIRNLEGKEVDAAVSEDGKTRIVSTGQEMEIQKIASIRDGKITFQMEDGSLVDADDISYGSEGDAIIYDAVASLGIGPRMSDVLVKGFTTSREVPATVYAKGMQDAFRYGKWGVPQQQMESGVFTSRLTEHQRQQAYEIGRMAAKEQVQAKKEQRMQEAARRKKQKKPGKVRFEGDETKLTGKQKTNLRALEAIADALGIQIYVFESEVESDGVTRTGSNGWYDVSNGSIHIDLYAGADGNGTMLFTAAHELTHFIKDQSPEKFQTLADFLMEQYGKKGVSVQVLVENQMAKARKHGYTLDYDGAFEEVVADSMETMLTDGTVLQELKRRNRGLWQTVKDYVLELCQKIREAYKGLKPDSLEGRIVSEMLDAAEEMRRLFTEGLLDAAENFTGSEGIKQNSDGNLKLSTRDRNDAQSLISQIQSNMDTLSKMDPVSTVTGSEMNKSARPVDAAMEYVESFGGSVSREGFGVVRFSKTKVKTGLIGHGLGNAKMETFAAVPAVIQYGVQIGFRDNWKGTQKDSFVFGAPVTYMDETVYVGVIVERDRQSGMYYVHEVVDNNGNIFVFENKKEEPTSDRLRPIAGNGDTVVSSSNQMVSQEAETVNQKSSLRDQNESFHGSGAVKNTTREGGVKMQVREIGNSGKFYVQADRQVLTGIDPKAWKNQIANYINETIRKEQDVAIPTADGHVLLLTGRSAYKLSDQNIASIEKKVRGLLSDDAYALKGRAATHIDELIQVARFDNGTPDLNNKHENDIGEDGFNYYEAYFQDFDGKYYRVVFSAGINASEETVYSIGQIRERRFPAGRGSSSNEALKNGRKSSSDAIIYTSEGKSQVKNAIMQAYEKALEKKNSEAKEKFSLRDQDVQKMNAVLEKQNEKLREDVASLKELLKLQKSLTHGKLMNEKSVDDAAGYLMRSSGAKGNKAELSGLLKDVYSYIAGDAAVSWDGIMEKAQPAAGWIQAHMETKQQLDPYGAEVLKELRGSRIYLDESQRAEAEYQFGSVNAFRKQLFGTVTITDKDSVSLDSKWAELSQMYPDVFDPNTSAPDMPGALLDAVDSLKNMGIGEMWYDKEAARQDLLQQIYDSYWRVSTLHTVADVKQKQINRLKGEHIARLNKIKAQNQENIQKLKAEHSKDIQKVREDMRKRALDKEAEIRKRYQDSRAKSVEGRRRTDMRHKVQRVMKELNDLLLKETKERHVPIELQKAVAEALDAVNMDTVEAEQRIAKLRAEMAKTTDPGKIQEIARKIANVQGMGDKMRERLQKLKAGYDAIIQSEDPLIANSYSPEVAGQLMTLEAVAGDTPLRDMNLKQLEAVYNAYTMVLTTVRNANRMFSENLKTTRDETARQIMEEVQSKSHGKLKLPGQEAVSTFSWNNTKPVYAMERLGSETLKRVYQAIRDGQDVYAVDMQEAKKFRLAQDRKHNRKGWNLKEQHEFRLASGEVSLNLEQIMSLYALSRRKEGLAHLLGGGFVFGKDSEVVVSKKGIPVTYRTEDATAYRLTPEELNEITGTLTPEQKAYAEEMQKFLSQVMGEKGNEISMQLYGIRSFQDEAYYPIRSAGQYMERAKAQALQKEQGQISLVNAGFTKSTVPHAENPIVLDGFSDVWAEHVQEMSMYHGLALPLEDFRKVYNYRMKDGADGNFQSVNAAIENAYGKAATGYLDQLYRDLNANVVKDSREDIGNRLTGKFKKSAVMASASVLIQQFSALPRAFALIDPKYFVGTKIDRKRHNELWEELKEYSPVAFIKEMGYFDTGVGLSGKEYLLQQEYGSIREKLGAILHDGNYRDELLGALPALADEMTWCNIWEAVKRETRKQHPEMKVNSPQFLETAGRRFSEIIDKTQVYDSVLSRSANMRGKTWYMNAITSFMAEPTTVVNMMEDALRKKDGKQIAKVSASVFASQIMNALLESLVYAARDDDEDKTWLEKYLSAVAAELVEGVNPVSYYPLLKDLWSLAQGYDVERPDMTLFGYAVDALNQLNTALEKLGKAESEEETAKAQANFMESMWGLADAAASLLGLPLKNIRRDVKGAASLVRTAWADLTRRDTTALSLQDAIWNEVMQTIPFFGKRYYRDKRDQLYRAMTEGDREYARRLEKTYASEDTFHGAVRTALREHDSRIWEAAVAWNEGNLEKYIQIAQKIRGENHFTQDDIVLAIRAEAESMLEKEDSGKDRTIGLFNTEKLGVALAQDNGEMVKIISEDLMDTDMRKGKTRDEAKEELESSVRGAVKKQYLDNGMERTLAIKQLTRYGDLEREEAAVKVECWDWLKANPDSSATEVQVEGYLKTRENGRSVQECGISMEVYLREKKAIDAFQADHDEKGASIPYSRINKAFPYIDSLTLTSEQKTAMALACGWELKTVERNKLW